MKHTRIIVPDLVSEARKKQIQQVVKRVIAERKSGKNPSKFSAKSIIMLPNKT